MEVSRATCRHKLITDTFHLEKPFDPATKKLILVLGQLTRISGVSATSNVLEYEGIGISNTEITILQIKMLTNDEDK